MCGIVGALGRITSHELGLMAHSIRHRGPDAHDQWLDQDAGIGLGHRRLAMVDLTPTGAQPMHSASSRLVITFNGEIYNHRELRARLARTTTVAWRGLSDTEVLLACIESWGLQETLAQANGMFAFALWDRHLGTLQLVRDRLGEKPLYVAWFSGRIVFASELRALRVLRDWTGGVAPSALGLLLRFGFVPAPWSIHPHVFKLPAGSILQLSGKDLGRPIDVAEFKQRCCRYWSPLAAAESGLTSPWQGTRAAAIAHLGELLDDSVRLRMLADVPVGALLSGGIDSSLVVSSLQRQSPKPVSTFTVGFESQAHDERASAAAVAAYLGTHHESILLPDREALEAVSTLCEIFDEPFSDASQIPALLVARVARKTIAAALTGDGGDEIFHGYQRYRDAQRNWQTLGRLSTASRAACASVALAMARVIPAGATSQRLLRQADRLCAASFRDYYLKTLTFSGANHLLPDSPNPAENCYSGLAALTLDRPALGATRSWMRYFDQTFWLPEGIHTKLDRTSMSCSLELRVPLLDPRIVDFSWTLPDEWHVAKDQGKSMLRDLLFSRVPRKLLERPKQGFDVPLEQWLRGPLRAWAQDILASRVAHEDEFIDQAQLRAMFREHLSRRGDYSRVLWSALTFLQWKGTYGQ